VEAEHVQGMTILGGQMSEGAFVSGTNVPRSYWLELQAITVASAAYNAVTACSRWLRCDNAFLRPFLLRRYSVIILRVAAVICVTSRLTHWRSSRWKFHRKWQRHNVNNTVRGKEEKTYLKLDYVKRNHSFVTHWATFGVPYYHKGKYNIYTADTIYTC